MFFLIPIGVNFRARRYPVVTFTLMGICTLIWLIQLCADVATDGASEEWVMANLWLTPAHSGWWTYITSQFVHAGILHLVGNMIYLFLFGACVEDLIDRLHFVGFYLLCGIGAALAHIAASPEHFASAIPLGGASGAISGCIGGFLLLLARRKIEFKWVILFWFRIWSGNFMLPARLVISCWFLKDLASMLLSLGSHGGGVAFGAHVGGTLCGIGLIALEKLRFKRHPELLEDVEEPEAPVVSTRPAARMRATLPVTAPPPVVEAPNIFLLLNGEETGPFNSHQVQQLFATAVIQPDTLYWLQGMETWQSAEELRQPGR
jgi:membrane associated rhomboid family serine protease